MSLAPISDPELRKLVTTRRLMAGFLAPMLLLLIVLSALQYQQRMDEAIAQQQRLANQNAQDLQLLARPAMDHVQDLRRLMEDIWLQPPDPGPALGLALSTRNTRAGGDGWAIPSAELGARFGQVWWAEPDGRPFDPAWQKRAAAFVAQARVAHARAPGFEATWFAGMDVNTSFGYPWVSPDGILSSMELPTLRALAPVRAAAAARTRARLARGPDEVSHWGPPYRSQLAGYRVVSHMAPVKVDGQVVGEVSLDFRLDDLQNRVKAWTQPGERDWIVDAQGRVLADSAPESEPAASANARWAHRAPGGLSEAQLQAAVNGGGPQRAGDWILAAATRPGSPWTFVSATPRAELRARILPSLLPNAVIALTLLLSLLAAQWFLSRHFVRPATQVLEYLRALSADHRAPAPPLSRRWRVWTDALADTFARQHQLQQRERGAQAERQQAREEIERQRESLRQSEKLSAMGSLLAGVAHELNNPLAIVMGRAGLLEDKLQGSPMQTDAQRIREAAERCGRLVHTFLNMARGKPAQRGPVALNDIVQAAADMLGYTLRSHGIALTLDLDAQLPPVEGDADQLGQVILNLLVNAQQALADTVEPRSITVSSGVDEARQQVWLRVQDNGPGVPEAVRGRLFEPFFTTKAEGLGTGLGLSVSRGLASEHGGSLMLETRPGEAGASFLLSLPGSAATGPQPDTATPHDLAVMADAPQEPEPQRLLVVDDEPALAALMRDTLEDAGYEVATAESGAVALALLAEARFDGVVSDLRMPEVDGAELWRSLQATQPALAARTLFVTGDILSPAAAAFVRASGCPALEKPFRPQALVAAVRRLLA